MSTLVTLEKGSLPVGFCFSTYQNLYETFIDATTAYISGSTNSFNFGPTTPSVDSQDRPWIRTDANYNQERLYVYSTQYSKWLAPHPDFPGKVVMWGGDISTIDTLDGGEAGAVTATTGPMWEKHTSFNGKMPIGPGTLDQGTVVALASTGGTEKVSLAEAEMPPHAHDVNGRSLVELDDSPIVPSNQSTKHIIIDDDWISGVNTKSTEETGGTAGVVAAHQNMPPYYGIWFIKRSARLYYRAV